MLIHFHFHLDGSAVYIIDKKQSTQDQKVGKRDWGDETEKARKNCRALFSRLAVSCARETSFSNLALRVGHFLGSHVKVCLSFVLLESAMSKAYQILRRY